MNRFLLFVLFTLLSAAAAQAQFEIKGASTNLLDPRRAGASAALDGLSAASFTITPGNKVYTVAPSVTISGGGGTGATATAVLSGGATGTFSGITITNRGRGYTSAPSITFGSGTSSSGTTNPSGTGNASNFVLTITVRGGGSGYVSAPTVTLSAPPSGITATATATVSGGAVTGFSITLEGSGYVTPPAVSIAPPPPSPSGGPAVTTPQFAGAAGLSATAGAISDTLGITAGRYSRARDMTIPASPVTTIVLTRASFGYSFASGAPLYLLGDEILRPSVRWDGVTVAESYWRAQPVQPTETFSPQGASNVGTLSALPYLGAVGSSPLETVAVTNSSTNSKQVTISGAAPSTLISGAVLLGSTVTTVNGSTVTLQTNANQTISSSTVVNITPYQPYYFSPHAGRVFATQPGRVTITWVSAVPDTTNSGVEGATPTYKFRRETFAVSSGTTRPVRTMFWTEKSFDAKPVYVPEGRIVRVNPVYNTFFPSNVVSEYVPVGTNPGASGLPPETRTVWYESELGPASLRAYNAEGRLFVEYLGSENQGTSGVHQFLGADILDVKRVAEVQTLTALLGTELRPRDEAPENEDDQLVPDLVSTNITPTKPPHGTHLRPDGVSRYFAERENLDPDRVTLYWNEPKDAAIHFLAAPSAPGLSLLWPKLKRNYLFVWPDSISQFQPVNVTQVGNGPATALQFAANNLPQVIYQDDPVETETEMDGATQRLLVDFTESSDKTNRSLLKFGSVDGPWYVRLYIQAYTKLGSPEIPDPDGAGPLTGTPAVYTLNDQNADGIADYSPTSPTGPGTAATAAIVGTRLEPPTSGLEVGGYVAEGRCYSPEAYINPFTAGVPASTAGGIIPVNAIPGQNSLVVWWMKQVPAPSDKFQPFYVPAVAARYTVSYPASPQDLVIASGKGIENPGLTPEQTAGIIYVQNNESLVGYNPNEEHALMLTGNAYALRDDLNNTTAGPDYTSQPYVLIAYTDAGNRPAMRVARVVRSNVTYPLSFVKAAGTPVQPPMPLTALPLPLRPDGSVRNEEAAGVADTLVANTPSEIAAAYSKFTFEDRKGQHWLYRGPHGAGTPTFIMRFYYYSLPGFYVPKAVPQPAVGTIMPFIATTGDKVEGTAADVTYIPKWPDDVAAFGAQAAQLGVLSTAETLALPKAGLPQVRGQTSAQVLYQQSIASVAGNPKSVLLHDPTRAKTYLLGAANALQSIPPSVLTTDYAGRTYFQTLPPHLQNRFYFDSTLGTKGGLVLIGEFIDEISGEDYFNLNALSNDDVIALQAICPPADSVNSPLWSKAISELNGSSVQIGGLATTLETWREYQVAQITPVVASTATAQALMTSFDQIEGNEVASIVILNGGRGYLTPPTVTLTAPVDDPSVYSPSLQNWPLMLARHRATATAAISGGSVTGFSLTDAGLYYQSYSPSVTISPPNLAGQILSLTPTSPGSGYSSVPPTITISPPAGGGTTATATATVSGGVVTSVTITHPGSGYNAASPPTITVSPPPNLKAVAPAENRTVALRDISEITDPDTAVDSYALSSTGAGTGYVTLVFGNGEVFTDEGDPVVMQIIKVSPTLYRGDLKVLPSSNPLDEQVVLRHSGDYGARPENFEFQWRYAYPDNGAPPTVPAGAANSTDATINTTDSTSTWFKPNGTWPGSILVGGSPSAAISTPAVIMADTYFTMSYRKIVSGQAADAGWSEWMTPKLVEGWIKRVLAKITPFNQRTDDLYNNALNTDVSMLTQAGTRWEGDIALNLENINDAGLIEIYETILNRGKSFTIGSGIDFAPSNDALLLAAGYLNDLYTILGNEAYADSANPTISIDDQTTVTEVNTSRFSFEGQVANSLDEELALLRGRDNSASPGTAIAPAYNRLFWNYTRGINSGEVLYAVNYNIKEKTGSSTANGILDAADAQRMFPQGHGDAYGHYLTALTGYYKLLTHPEFTWVPRAEAVTVLGQAVLIDYKDERKLAAAAANLARTSQQVIGLVHRKVYKDDPALGWQHLRDSDETRAWGLDETVSRSAQGSFFHWVTGNALLLDEDTAHTGVQKIDRTTVPELNELVSAADAFQTNIDNANAHLNPLGLSPGAIAFDISPAQMQAGQSHYEQIYARALRSVLNAKGSFDQAAKMTRLLRNQENQVSDANTSVVDQEGAFESQLIEIYGTPYAGDIGPGKAFPQGYTGPDLQSWFIIDRPSDLVNLSSPATTVSIQVPLVTPTFGALTADQIKDQYSSSAPIPQVQTKTYNIAPNQWAQYAQTIAPDGSLGRRAQTGGLQDALMEIETARTDLLEANQQLVILQRRFEREATLAKDLVASHLEALRRQGNATVNIATTEAAAAVLDSLGDGLQWAGEAARDAGDITSEALPKIIGLLGGDFTAPVRSGIEGLSSLGQNILMATALASRAAGSLLGATVTGLGMELDGYLMSVGFTQEEAQALYELEQLYAELVSQHYQFHRLATSLQTASQKTSNLIATGQSILSERESYRQRAAAVISGYRTKDLTFRTFRNEALEQYRTLFDLASRYTYLAAKSYDYETGLLGTPAGQAVIASIVSSRSLGDLSGDIPQATTSTLGDAGLAGRLAQMNADFSVAEGRLGINNPDPYGTLFSVRSELYRITTDAASTADDDAWQQSLEQAIRTNLLSDSDVARHCNNLRKPDGSNVPGLIIPFSTTIQHAKNFFGLSYAAGDHNYSPSSYSTKISSIGIVLPGYIGMDPYASGSPGAGGPASSHPDALGATPYVYLIPCGDDFMLAPPLGDTNTVRSWTVHDQALPLPYNLGASNFNTTNFFTSTGTLSEQPWIVRKHQAFRPVADAAFFYGSAPAEFTNTRLIGRSVWNNQWKLVIPAYTLLSNEQEGLNRFVRSVKDVQIFLRTYSHSGN